jgi:hypothetical protein
LFVFDFATVDRQPVGWGKPSTLGALSSDAQCEDHVDGLTGRDSSPAAPKHRI